MVATIRGRLRAFEGVRLYVTIVVHSQHTILKDCVVRISGARLGAFEWVRLYIARLSNKLCFFEMPVERRGLLPKKEK